MRVALYLRRSTADLQPDSLLVQEELLRNYARERGMDVVAVFSDSASGIRVAGRAGFQRLVATVLNKRRFEAVLVRDVSRFGRFSETDEAGYWEFLLLTHGCRVIYCEESFRDDSSPFAALLKAIKRVMASEFSTERSRLVTHGHTRAAGNGFLVAGHAPYGMKRVLTDQKQNVICDLKLGDRKSIGSFRVKLAAGREASVVRRIFELFADEQASMSEIAATLNRENVPSPGSRQWTRGAVRYILRNPVYAGTIRYCIHAKRNKSCLAEAVDSDQIVELRGAHEAIISAEQWERVQRYLRDGFPLRSDDELVQAAREAFQKYGTINLRMMENVKRSVAPQYYARRFSGGIDEALTRAFDSLLLAHVKDVADRLRTKFTVSQDGFLITVAELLTVLCVPSFLRSDCHGRVRWVFDSSGWAEYPVVIGLGMPPAGENAAPDLFYFRPRKLGSRKVFIRRTNRWLRRRYAIASSEQLLKIVGRHIYHHNPVATARFLAAARERPVLNLSRLADEIGMPRYAVRDLYLSLVNEVTLPPLFRKHGRRVTVTCSHCRVSRELIPADAMKLRTDVCRACRDTVNVTSVRCKACGVRREMPKYERRRFRETGLCWHCRPAHAALSTGVRAQKEERSAKSARSERAATAIVAEMQKQRQRFADAKVWWSYAPRPTITWIDCASGDRFALTLTVARGAPRLTPPQMLDRRRWHRRSSAKFAKKWELIVAFEEV